jgi:DNA-binding NtrC family response regulator
MRHTSDSSEESKAREKSEATGRRVLVIEDEGRLRDMLQRAVRDMGFEINCAGSAEAGMRVLEDRPIDIRTCRRSC